MLGQCGFACITRKIKNCYVHLFVREISAYPSRGPLVRQAGEVERRMRSIRTLWAVPVRVLCCGPVKEMPRFY